MQISLANIFIFFYQTDRLVVKLVGNIVCRLTKSTKEKTQVLEKKKLRIIKWCATTTRKVKTKCF